jgi:thiol-disulfide isomerase/thioredoxin
MMDVLKRQATQEAAQRQAAQQAAQSAQQGGKIESDILKREGVKKETKVSAVSDVKSLRAQREAVISNKELSDLYTKAQQEYPWVDWGYYLQAIELADSDVNNIKDNFAKLYSDFDKKYTDADKEFTRKLESTDEVDKMWQQVIKLQGKDEWRDRRLKNIKPDSKLVLTKDLSGVVGTVKQDSTSKYKLTGQSWPNKQTIVSKETWDTLMKDPVTLKIYQEKYGTAFKREDTTDYSDVYKEAKTKYPYLNWDAIKENLSKYGLEYKIYDAVKELDTKNAQLDKLEAQGKTVIRDIVPHLTLTGAETAAVTGSSPLSYVKYGTEQEAHGYTFPLAEVEDIDRYVNKALKGTMYQGYNPSVAMPHEYQNPITASAIAEMRQTTGFSGGTFSGGGQVFNPNTGQWQSGSAGLGANAPKSPSVLASKLFGDSKPESVARLSGLTTQVAGQDSEGKPIYQVGEVKDGKFTPIAESVYATDKLGNVKGSVSDVIVSRITGQVLSEDASGFVGQFSATTSAPKKIGKLDEGHKELIDKSVPKVAQQNIDIINDQLSKDPTFLSKIEKYVNPVTGFVTAEGAAIGLEGRVFGRPVGQYKTFAAIGLAQIETPDGTALVFQDITDPLGAAVVRIEGKSGTSQLTWGEFVNKYPQLGLKYEGILAQNSDYFRGLLEDKPKDTLKASVVDKLQERFTVNGVLDYVNAGATAKFIIDIVDNMYAAGLNADSEINVDGKTAKLADHINALTGELLDISVPIPEPKPEAVAEVKSDVIKGMELLVNAAKENINTDKATDKDRQIAQILKEHTGNTGEINWIGLELALKRAGIEIPVIEIPIKTEKISIKLPSKQVEWFMPTPVLADLYLPTVTYGKASDLGIEGLGQVNGLYYVGISQDDTGKKIGVEYFLERGIDDNLPAKIWYRQADGNWASLQYEVKDNNVEVDLPSDKKFYIDDIKEGVRYLNKNGWISASSKPATSSQAYLKQNPYGEDKLGQRGLYWIGGDGNEYWLTQNYIQDPTTGVTAFDNISLPTKLFYRKVGDTTWVDDPWFGSQYKSKWEASVARYFLSGNPEDLAPPIACSSPECTTRANEYQKALTTIKKDGWPTILELAYPISIVGTTSNKPVLGGLSISDNANKPVNRLPILLAQDAKKGKFTIFQLSADWCKPCQLQKAYAENVVKNWGNENFNYYYVDVETPEYAQLAQYDTDFPQNVTSVPVTLIFREGKLVSTISGGKYDTELQYILESNGVDKSEYKERGIGVGERKVVTEKPPTQPIPAVEVVAPVKIERPSAFTKDINIKYTNDTQTSYIVEYEGNIYAIDQIDKEGRKLWQTCSFGQCASSEMSPTLEGQITYIRSDKNRADAQRYKEFGAKQLEISSYITDFNQYPVEVMEPAITPTVQPAIAEQPEKPVVQPIMPTQPEVAAVAEKPELFPIATLKPSLPKFEPKWDAVIPSISTTDIPISGEQVTPEPLFKPTNGRDKGKAAQVIQDYSYRNPDGSYSLDIVAALRAGGDTENVIRGMYSDEQIAKITEGKIIIPKDIFEQGQVQSETISSPLFVQKLAKGIIDYEKQVRGEIATNKPSIDSAISSLHGGMGTKTDKVVDQFGSNINNIIDNWQKNNPDMASAIDSKRDAVVDVLQKTAESGKDVGTYTTIINDFISEKVHESAGALSQISTTPVIGGAATQLGGLLTVAGGGAAGLINVTTLIPSTLMGVALSMSADSALASIGKGNTPAQARRDALETLLGVVLGTGAFFISAPYKIKADPMFQAPYVATMVISPAKLKNWAEYTGTAINPKVYNWSALAMEVDVPRITPPAGMSPYAMRNFIDAATGNIINQANAKMPDFLRSGKPVNLYDPVSGQVIARLTGIEEVLPNVMFSSNPSKAKATVEMLNTDKQYDAQYVAREPLRSGVAGAEKALGMEFNSPNANATFFAGSHLTGEIATDPVVKAKIFSPSDYKQLPNDVLALLYEGKVTEAKELIRDKSINGDPNFPRGIYPLYKWYKDASGNITFEYELVDTLIYKPIPDVPWWAKDKNSNTAITYVKSPIVSIDPQTGEGIKIGQKVPIVWMISENAVKEGYGMPSLPAMYKSEAIGLLNEIKKRIPFSGYAKRPTAKSAQETAIATSEKFQSVSPLIAKSPEWATGNRESIIRNANELVRKGDLEVWRRPRGTALIVDKQTGKILFTQSAGEKFGLAGGGIDKGEYPVSGMAREVFEETGLRPLKVEKLTSFDDANPIISDKTGAPVFRGGKLQYNKHHVYLVLVDDVSKAKLGSDLINSTVYSLGDAKNVASKGTFENYAEQVLNSITASDIQDFITNPQRGSTPKWTHPFKPEMSSREWNTVAAELTQDINNKAGYSEFARQVNDAIINRDWNSLHDLREQNQIWARDIINTSSTRTAPFEDFMTRDIKDLYKDMGINTDKPRGVDNIVDRVADALGIERVPSKQISNEVTYQGKLSGASATYNDLTDTLSVGDRLVSIPQNTVAVIIHELIHRELSRNKWPSYKDLLITITDDLNNRGFNKAQIQYALNKVDEIAAIEYTQRITGAHAMDYLKSIYEEMRDNGLEVDTNAANSVMKAVANYVKQNPMAKVDVSKIANEIQPYVNQVGIQNTKNFRQLQIISKNAIKELQKNIENVDSTAVEHVIDVIDGKAIKAKDIEYAVEIVRDWKDAVDLRMELADIDRPLSIKLDKISAELQVVGDLLDIRAENLMPKSVESLYHAVPERPGLSSKYNYEMEVTPYLRKRDITELTRVVKPLLETYNIKFDDKDISVEKIDKIIDDINKSDKDISEESIKVIDAFGISEKAPSEKVPTEKIPTEKVPSELTTLEGFPSEKGIPERFPKESIIGEKIPTEKTPSENLPKEKILTEKIPKEKIVTSKIVLTQAIPREVTTRKTGLEAWEALTTEQKLASIVWKQGWWNYALPPPYTQNVLIGSSKPFQGTKIYHGPKAAYKSVARVKGADLPERIDIDLGIMDITFQKDKDGKDVKIYYRADPKQLTTGQGPIGYPQPQTRVSRRYTSAPQTSVVK